MIQPTDYVDELMKAQRLIMDKLEKDKNANVKDGAAAIQVSVSGDNKPRRSKWDNPHTADASGKAAVRK